MRNTWWAICLLLSLYTQGQDANFKVLISNDMLAPGDTLDMVASYAIGDRKLPPATFAVTLLGPNDKVWQMRWPMVDGSAECTLVLPKELPAGRYNLLFAVQPRFFKLFCELIYPKKAKNITAIIGNAVDSKSGQFQPGPDGKFAIEGFYFEDIATVKFLHDDKKVEGPPLLKVDAWLDSAFMPAAYGVKQLVVNHPDKEQLTPDRLKKDSFYRNDFSYFQSTYPLQLRAKKFGELPPQVLYDSLYLGSGFVQKPNAIFDCMQDSMAANYQSVYDMLEKNLKGMTVTPWDDVYGSNDDAAVVQQLSNETMVLWNRKWYRLFYAGNFGNPSVLLFPPSAFVGVRVYDPPFYKPPNTRLSFGTIAFFERKYPIANPFPYNHSFVIHGYTPALYDLPL